MAAPLSPRRIFTAPDWPGAHEHAFLPWLREKAASASQHALPTLVVAPARSDAYFLKSAALDAGLNLFGLHFVTPLEVRDRLRGAFGLPRALPLREHLRLLLAAAAECDEHDPASAAVAAAPDHLLKAIDLLGAGGWKFREAGPASLHRVAASFTKLLRGCGFDLIHDLDRELLAAAPRQPAAFASIFITGFDGAHWPLWPLLATSVHVAEEATICLRDPRTEAQDIDAAWIGTWEQEFAAAEPLADATAPRPFENALGIPESPAAIAGRSAKPLRGIEFLVGQNTAEHACAIVQKALHFLADPACHRLGILLPGPGALARRVAESLATLDIPHNDGIAHSQPGPLETPDWPAWLELQQNPRLPALLRFLRSFTRAADLFPANAENDLRRACNDVLIDDLAVLAGWLARDSATAALAQSLRAFLHLPGRATLSQFLAATITAFARLGWTERTAELQRVTRDWAARLDVPLSRQNFLRWLGEVLVSDRTARAPTGNHPYARTHLLPHANAETQTWTHLIVAGLNEGQWPPSFEEGGWLGEDEIDALNRRVAGLNVRATVQGRQGEGHVAVQPGKALCLGPAQRRALALRQFLNTLESTSVAIAATAQLFDEAKPDRQLNPGEFFTRLYFCARGKALSQATMTALREETARWLTVEEPIAGSAAPAIAQTRIAFDARRDRTQPFREYEFALRTPLANPVRLSATAWESALTAPALVWMQQFLGIEARAADTDPSPWGLAIGQWSHAWLRDISDALKPNAFTALPLRHQIIARVQQRAGAFCERALDVLRSCDRAMPDWWLSLWHQAYQVSETLAHRVAEVTGQTHAATEWKLPDTAIGIDAARALHVRGRIDLILATGPEPTAAPWIVDYKTGRKKSLAPSSRLGPDERVASVMKRLRTGDGLQLALYALALRQLGAPSFGVSLLTPDLDLAGPQLTSADLPLGEPLWRGLCAMQDSGIFGLRGALRSEFAFNDDYPLATLAIESEVLDEKWARTHPDLVASDEDSA